MGLKLENVKNSGWVETHLRQIDLDFETGSRNVLLGRTLAGKTTLLRIMAGLDRPTSGVIFDGQDVTGVSVRKRSIAMVYQQFINYPSLTVYDNIASPLKIGGLPKKEIDRRVRETLKCSIWKACWIDARRAVRRTAAANCHRPCPGQGRPAAAAGRTPGQPRLQTAGRTAGGASGIFRKRAAIVVYTTTEPSEALMLGGNVVVLDEGAGVADRSHRHGYQRPETLRAAEVFSDPPINALDSTSCCQRQGGHGRQHSGPLDRAPCRSGRRIVPICLPIQPPVAFQPGRTGTSPFPAMVELAEINGSETFITSIMAKARSWCSRKACTTLPWATR
jgi:glycerol transport system ATP-binding protein